MCFYRTVSQRRFSWEMNIERSSNLTGHSTNTMKSWTYIDGGRPWWVVVFLHLPLLSLLSWWKRRKKRKVKSHLFHLRLLLLLSLIFPTLPPPFPLFSSSDVMFFQKWLGRYRLEHIQAKNCPTEKDLGLILIDSQELKEQLLPSPLRCLKVGQAPYWFHIPQHFACICTVPEIAVHISQSPQSSWWYWPKRILRSEWLCYF